MNSTAELDQRSIELRKVLIELLVAGGRGHLASALSLIEIFRVLYDDILKYDASNPDWEGRDRVILSKGHGCMAQYALLAEKGFFPRKEFDDFCRFEGLLGGHPEHRIPGIEASTGSLGHGLALGAGMAMGLRLKKSNSRVYVIIGDGESNEGSIWESLLALAHHRLHNLTLLIDHNHQQSYGENQSILSLGQLSEKLNSFGFDAVDIDGHCVESLKRELNTQSDQPRAIVCHTIKGRGIQGVEKNLKYHHVNRFNSDQAQDLLEGLCS